MNIVTAIGNPILNEKLRENKELNIVGKDIQYQEGILEILEERNDIDLLIISNILPEEYGFYKLINKIKNTKEQLQIIIFLEEKNDDIENFLNSKNIYKIYYFNEFNLNNFINSFYSNNSDLLRRNN